MPQAREVPKPVCQQCIDLMVKTSMSNMQIGELLRDEHPNLFDDAIQPSSVIERVRRWSQRHGLVYPSRRAERAAHATLRYLDEVPELVIPYEPRLIVISDLHASAHDMRIVDLACEVIAKHNITAAVFNGDQLDNSYLGHKGVRSRWAAPFDENVEQFTQIANAMKEAGLERQVVIQGNHDDKPMRGTDGELTYPQWFGGAVLPHLDAPTSYTVTHRYYCIMEPEIPAAWPYPDGWRNFPWRFTHQREYGRNPLTVGKRLINALGPTNIVCGHMHHLARGWHESGLYRVVDAGTFQHRDGAAYKVNRDSTHPQWNQGFVTLIDNRPQLWEL